MYIAESSHGGSSPGYPNPSRHRRFTRVVLPFLGVMAGFLVFVVVADANSHGVASALRFAVVLVAVESMGLAYASALVLGRAPPRIWQSGDELVFRAHRVAGGYFASSEVHLRRSDIHRVRVVGREVLIAGTGRIASRGGAPGRLFPEWIVVDAALLGPLGIDPGADGARASASPHSSSAVPGSLGARTFYVGQTVMLLGGGLLVALLVAGAVARPQGPGQSEFQGVAVALAVVCLLGFTLAVAGMARRSRGQSGSS